MKDLDVNRLLSAAIAARGRAYAPYSKFLVGAALLCPDGEIFSGCNVENISYGLTICAERTAAATAISQGHQKFTALAVVTETNLPTSPCGACRQFLAEFSPDLWIVSATLAGAREEWQLATLLPRPKTGILDSTD